MNELINFANYIINMYCNLLFPFKCVRFNYLKFETFYINKEMEGDIETVFNTAEMICYSNFLDVDAMFSVWFQINFLFF